MEECSKNKQNPTKDRAVSEAERRNDCRSAAKNHAVQKRQQSKSMDGGSWQPHASVEIKHFEKQEHFL